MRRGMQLRVDDVSVLVGVEVGFYGPGRVGDGALDGHAPGADVRYRAVWGPADALRAASFLPCGNPRAARRSL
jgi:hypothetical protein